MVALCGEGVLLNAEHGGEEDGGGGEDGDGERDICSKVWGAAPTNATGGNDHFDYLENRSR